MASNLDQNPFETPISELESALKSFISIYNIELIENKTNQELLKKTTAQSNEQIKTNIEQSANELYEKAHNLETLILRHRLEISKNSPEELLQEEIQCLRAELKRKEDLLNDTKEKLGMCEHNLKNLGNALDYQFKNRLEMTIQGYLPNENMPYPNVPSNQPPSVSGNQSFDQASSLDNSVILLQ